MNREEGLGLLLLGVTILGVALVRVRMLELPLERDEGDYAYGGLLLLQGLRPYTDFYTMRLPGIYVTYAMIQAAFGEGYQGIRAALLLVNECTIVLVYLMGRRFFSPLAGAVSGMAFAVLSLGANGHGLFANGEHFVILWVMSSLCMLAYFSDRDALWPVVVAGVFAGLGFATKQHAIFFAAAGAVYIVAAQMRRESFDQQRTTKQVVAYGIGVAIPFLLICLVALVWWKNFSDMWFWTVSYASKYVSASPGKPLANFMRKFALVSRPATLLWMLAGASFLGGLWCRRVRVLLPFLVAFAIAAALAISVGFYFRLHYFLFAFPVVALLAGASFQALREWPGRPRLGLGVACLLLAVALLTTLGSEWDRIARMDPDRIARKVFGENPFPESLVIAEYIKERTRPDDTLLVLGSEPQINFYANRRSPTGHMHMYPLMERHPFALEMQEQLIRDTEAARPAYVVAVFVRYSWLTEPLSHMKIFGWAERYLAENYVNVGLIEVFRDEPAKYTWNGEGLPAAPPSGQFIQVLRRADYKPPK